jgi:selenocysteine lyase/cysteine desulfurase
MPFQHPQYVFPVLKHTAYLNAGTCGPLPGTAATAIAEEALAGAQLGRGIAYYERLAALTGHSRAAWARLFRVPGEEIALTAGASDGIARVLGLIDWQPGDEVLISDEEHPGLLGPLGALVRRSGIVVRSAPFDQLAAAVTPETKLVAVSHVSWLRGAVADLAAIGAAGVPVLVDAAQSAGAIDVDLSVLRSHGIVAYAAAGQKWTCGPVGTGALWLDPAWAPDGGAGVWPTYGNLSDPATGLDAMPWPDARRLDSSSLSCELIAGSVAAFKVLEDAGWQEVHRAAIGRAAELAEGLAALGAEVAPRGASTLVSWKSADPTGLVAAAADEKIVLRDFAGQPWVRASCGAWTTEHDLERLLKLPVG